MLIFIAGVINILFPYVVHADIFGYEIPDLYCDITENVEETNEILLKAFDVSRVSPYRVLTNVCAGKTDVANTIHTASQSVAIAVATLLLLVDFFRKSVNFEFASKWENILLFLIKIIVVKQVVQNADVIMGHLYELFDYVNHSLTYSANGEKPSFLPIDDKKTILRYQFFSLQDFVESASSPWWSLQKTFSSGKAQTAYHDYVISPKAVHMFYPDAVFPENNNVFELGHKDFANPNGKILFTPSIEKIYIYPYFIFMKIIAYYIFIVVIGRTFELCVYTILAPIPLCGFASEITHDTAKNFIRNYIAVILQMAIIATMFAVYTSLTGFFASGDNVPDLKGIKLIEILILASLALGVHKSGEWSRRLVGAC